MNYSINAGGRLLELETPAVVGILNVTPDSFYEGSRIRDAKELVQRAVKMIEEGALWLDIGACSTRPGAGIPSAEEEWERLKPALGIIKRELPETVLSVDTFRSDIAERSHCEYGVEIINDISGGTLDDNMFKTVGKYRIPYILMHIQGSPENMQNNPEYSDVTAEVIGWLRERSLKLREEGVVDLIIDPGFGFGKLSQHNYTLLRELEMLKILDCPIVAGLSRKSMIWKSLSVSPEEALTGTIALNMAALERGADILRVHDVKEAVETVKMYLNLKG